MEPGKGLVALIAIPTRVMPTPEPPMAHWRVWKPFVESYMKAEHS